MSRVRKRAGAKGKAAKAPDEPDTVLSDPPQVAYEPPPSPGVAALAAKAAGAVSKALRSSARGLLGMAAVPEEPQDDSATVPGALDELGGTGAAGDDAAVAQQQLDQDAAGPAAPSAGSLAAAPPPAPRQHDMQQPAAAKDAGAAARLQQQKQQQDLLLGEDRRDQDVGGVGGGGGEDAEGGIWQPQQQQGSQGAASLGGCMQRALAAAHAAAERARSPRILPLVAPLLLVVLCMLLLAQGAAMGRQSRALAAYQRQLTGQVNATRVLQAHLAGLQSMVDQTLTPDLRHAEARAEACAADVGALTEQQQGLQSMLAALHQLAARATAAGEGGAGGGGEAGAAALAAMWSAAGAPLAGATDEAVLERIDQLVKGRVPAPDLALAGCGGTVAAHSPLVLRHLPWLQALRLRLLQLGRPGAATPHPSADALLLTARQLPGRCFPLVAQNRRGGPPAFVEVRLPGPARIATVELHMLLTRPADGGGGGSSGAANGTLTADGWSLPPTAPKEVSIALLNAGSSDLAAAALMQPPHAVVIGPEQLIRGPGARARVEVPVGVAAEVGGGGLEAGVVASGVRVEVGSNQAGGPVGLVCLGRIAVRGVPVGGESFC
jgi:hypothetical protein